MFPDRCEGHGLCFLEDEDLYPLDDDGHIAIPDETEVPTGDEPAAERGALACPVAALQIEQ